MNMIYAQAVNTVISPEIIACLFAALAGAGAVFGLDRLFRAGQRTPNNRRKHVIRQ